MFLSCFEIFRDGSRCFGMFRSFSHNLHVVATVQASLLQTGRLISSGVYTAECAAAMVEKTINTSKLLDFDVNWQSLSCFEPCLTKTFSICVILFHLVSCTMHNILCIILYYIIYINYIIFWIVYIYTSWCKISKCVCHCLSMFFLVASQGNWSPLSARNPQSAQMDQWMV